MGSYWLLLSGRLFQWRYSVLRNCSNREHLALRDEDHYYPGGGKEEEMEQDHTLCMGGVLSWKIITETWLRLWDMLSKCWGIFEMEEGEILNHFSELYTMVEYRKDWKCPAIPLPRGDGWKYGICASRPCVCASHQSSLFPNILNLRLHFLGAMSLPLWQWRCLCNRLI